MDSFLEYFTSTEETLQEKKQVKVEVAEELKDTCWLEERISESQIQSLKENYHWDIFEREMEKEEVEIFLTKIEFNLGNFGLFLILQPKLIPRVIKAVKLLDEMPHMDYMSFIRTPDGFEWKRIQDKLRPFLIEDGEDKLRPFLIEDGGLYDIQNGENWDL